MTPSEKVEAWKKYKKSKFILKFEPEWMRPEARYHFFAGWDARGKLVDKK